MEKPKYLGQTVMMEAKQEVMIRIKPGWSWFADSKTHSMIQNYQWFTHTIS